jgi:tetratricopeptide (TPR) repeat protein
MRRTYALVVFLLLANGGRAEVLDASAAFGIVSPPDRGMDTASGETISVARLRHKLVGKAMAAFSRAAKLANAGAWQMGAVELEKAVALDPEFSDAHGNLGAYYVRLGRLEDAVVEFRSAIALDPACGFHHSNLAVAMLMLGRPNDAETEARTAVGMDGADFKAQYLFGVLLARKAVSRDAAIPHLVYAARFLPEAHLTLAELYRAIGEDERAQVELDRYCSAQAKMASARQKAGEPRPGLR